MSAPPPLGVSPPSALQVLDVLFEHPIANIGTLVKQSGLTPTTVGKVLERFAQPELELVRGLLNRDDVVRDDDAKLLNGKKNFRG
ncbi:hypothetical protein ACONUD_17900 [Microbulbifer harenosus]|uniref:Uncharacterized protein n=1 Tax=Microbulbifer harenosus TaxID=2576840 RepID=A0ABY2UJ97_9GAMM|nr:hypothetical protein [Microbulbifer harenosus]TLM78186.1 hypothetical protein FDY93_07105 [Microbulbifer harenosus]